MRTTIRLTLKQHRFGVLGFGIILVAIAAGAAALAVYFNSLDIGTCATEVSEACDAIAQQMGAMVGPMYLLRGASVPIAILAGVFVGVPIVASEIERGTAILPWTVVRSRVRWFLPRVLIVGGVLVFLTALVGLSLDAMHQSLYPLVPITADLNWYEARGWLVPARALVGFAVGVLAGAALGRSLPGLFAGLVISGVMLAGTFAVGGTLNQTHLVDVSGDPGALRLTLALHDHTTGVYMGYEEAEQIMWPGDPAFTERFEEVYLGVPGSSSVLVVTRDVAIHGALALMAIVAAAVVVDRRRPY